MNRISLIGLNSDVQMDVGSTACTQSESTKKNSL